MDPVTALLNDLGTLTAEQRRERIAALTTEELAEFGERLNAQLEEARAAEPSDESIAALRTITEAAQVAAEVQGEREAEAERVRTEHEAAAAEAERALNGEQEEPPAGEGTEGETPPPGEGTETPPGEGAETPPAAEPGQGTEAPAGEGDAAAQAAAAATTAAAAPARVPIGRVRRPAQHTPAPEGDELRQVIVAAAGVGGANSEGQFTDMDAVGRATIDMARRIAGGPHNDGVRYPVAQIRTPYPDERQLTPDDLDTNRRRIEEVTSPRALAAAGGLCAPVPIRYEIPSLGTNERRVAGALAQFNADRGGVRYTTPPRIGDYAAGIGDWTIATDAAAVDDTTLRKPCVRIDCGDELEALIEAVTACGEVGNILARTYPERVAEFWRLLGVEFARHADSKLLRTIGAGSTTVTTDRLLGASRDILAAIDLLIAAIRDRHRMADTERIRALFPRVIRTMARVDLMRELPGSTAERLSVADAEIDRFIAERGVNATWTLDTEDGGTFGAQGDGVLVPFPDEVTWYAFPEGSWLYLDGGELDLGVTRDTVTNARNDYQMFMESFEFAAFVGHDSYRVTSSLCPDGSTAATVDTSLLCAAGS